jgi:hypothetical protein
MFTLSFGVKRVFMHYKLVSTVAKSGSCIQEVINAHDTSLQKAEETDRDQDFALDFDPSDSIKLAAVYGRSHHAPAAEKTRRRRQ